MKFILLILAIIIALFVWAGYLAGSELSTELKADAILANTEIGPLGANQYVLNFSCHGQKLASFDVDKDKVISERLTEDQITKLQKILHDNPYYQHIFELVTAGGAGNYWKPTFAFLRAKQNAKYTIPVVVGGLLGFYLGHELAALIQFDCDAASVVRFSQQDDAWKKTLKPGLARHYYLQVAGPFERTNSTEMKEIRQAIDDGRIDSTTFAKLASLAAYVQPRQSHQSWFTIDVIIWFWFPVALLIALSVLFAVLLTKSLTGRTKKQHGHRAVS